MLNIEAEVIAYLSANLDCKAYADVPRERPKRFVTVERTGGTQDLMQAVDRPTVAVQSWAETRLDAYTLADQVDGLMLRMPEATENVMGCARNGLYNFPDPDSRGARYQGLYELVTL